MKLTFTTFWLSLLLFLPFTSNSQNLLVNGSFEDDLTGWNNIVEGTGVATFSVSTTEKQEGDKAMKIAVETPGANAWDVQSLHSGWTNTPGKQYKITVYAKSLETGGKIRLLNQGTTEYSPRELTLTTEWKEYVWMYTPTEDVDFKIHYPFAGTFFIDNISVVEVVTTSPGLNVLENGSFEDDFTSWNNIVEGTGVAEFLISTTDKHEGDKAMKVVVTTPGANAWDVQSLHAGWNENIGKQYKITVFAKSLETGGKIRLLNQGATEYSPNDLTLTTEWKEYVWMYTPTEDVTFKIHYPFAGTFFIDNISISETDPSTPPLLEDSLKVLAAKVGLQFGTAVSDGPLQVETNYINGLKQHFSMVTPENVMKMDHLKPSETGPYNFAAADRLVNFALANNMKVRGHALLWHSQLPAWLTAKTWTKPALLAYLKEYIFTVVGRYQGKIAEWDVANELFSDETGNPLRNSVWITAIGPEVIDSAFKWAHQADPAAKLYYNDYSAETMNTKANQVYALVSGLKGRGIPVHGVGLQTHRAYNEGTQFFSQFDENIKRLGSLGVKVSLTELDLHVPIPATAEHYITQAHTYAQMLRTALANIPVVENFIIWGFTDKHSWIPQFHNGERGDALPFDAEYGPKPAYDSLVSVLKKAAGLVSSIERFTDLNTNLYPNPFTDQFSLQIAGQFQYTLSDITGRIYLTGKGTNYVQLGEELQTGIYSLKIENEKGIKTYKIIKSTF